MLFSVIIPTYNRVALLRETLESIFGQTFTDYEIIVVDDGSNDGTLAYLESLSGRVRVLTQSNKGPGSARNIGMTQARGDYLAFLDSDDLWFPWTLETYRDVIRNKPTTSFMVGKYIDFIESTEFAKTTRISFSALAFADYFEAAQHLGFVILTCSSVVVRRSEVIGVEGFSELNINAEDSDLWLRLGLVLDFSLIETPVICGYRRHASSVVANIEKTYNGISHIIQNEAAEAYPGGKLRQKERRAIITQHVRPVTLSLLKNHEYKKAIQFYRRTWLWNWRLGCLKYLCGFWLVLAKYFLRLD